MRKFLFALMAFCLMAGAAFAQRSITGKVTDEQGNPLPGTTVQIKGTTTGTVTDSEGFYSLSVNASAKSLLFSSIGMETQEIVIGESSVINATLKLSDKSITEVVVTGYNRARKFQFSGAAAVVSGKLVETVPVGAFDQALQGRAPGVLVNSGSGQPGSSANVVIRGIQSIQGAGAQPLYVVDGVPLPASDMQTINPNDFESLTILKDAAAAALYGARAGTGVIVITTKRGKAGQPKFMYRTQLGVTQAPNATNFDLMNSKEILAYEEREKIPGTPGWVYSPNNPAYAALPQATKDRYAFLLDSLGNISTDFTDVLFREGFSQLHEINASGGNEKSRYFFSGAFFDQQGTDLNSRLKRYTTRFNFDHTMNNFSMQFNSAVGYSQSDLSEGEFYAISNSARTSFQQAWRAKPYQNPYRPDGSLDFGPSSNLFPRVIANVIEAIENSSYKYNQIKVNSGLTLSYRLLPTLTARNTLGIDLANDRVSRAINANSEIGKAQTEGKGYYSDAYRINAQLINTSSLTFNQTFNKRHEVEAGAYFEVVRGWQSGFGFFLLNLDPRLSETGQGAGNIPTIANQKSYPQNARSAKSGFGIRSYFATARYTLDEKYTINGNIRRDGTSRILNPANKEVTTWAAGATWNAINEGFMKAQGFFTDLKVRVSYGAVPNIGSIATTTYGIPGNPSVGGGWLPITNYLGPQVPGFSAVTSFAGDSIAGLAPSTPGNPNLKIETIKKANFGVDVAAWDGRARLSVDYYRNRTEDLFVRQPLPGSAGFANMDINAGVMTNKGIELQLNVDVIKGRDFDLGVGLNHAFNKNNIEDLGAVNEYPLGTFIIREGLPYGSHYTLHYLGADPETGRPMYKGIDGKTVYAANDPNIGRFADFGTYFPKHMGGFNMDVRYKRFTLSAFFSYQFDVVRSNNIDSWITRGSQGYQGAVNGSRRLIDNQWQKPGDQKLYQSSLYDRDFTSLDLEDAKFFRFRNLNIAYNVPELSAFGRKLISGARIYVQAQNLFVWSPWHGPDPEDNNNISLNEFPNPRMMVAGIDINF